MKKVPLVIGLGIVLALAVAPATVFSRNFAATSVSIAVVQGRSSIYGSVYGEGRRPVGHRRGRAPATSSAARREQNRGPGRHSRPKAPTDRHALVSSTAPFSALRR